jgi:preprotein translocase subunit SecE
MAKKDEDKKTDDEESTSAKEDERDEKEDERDEEEEDRSSGDAGDADGKGAPQEGESDADDEGSRALARVEGDGEGKLATADGEVEEEAIEVAAASLGTTRYVMAGFFAAGMLGTYVLARALHGLWSLVATKDWFHRTFPQVAGIADDTMTTYAFIFAGVVGVIFVFRTYRKPEVKEWSNEVATELTKVKWPTKKEVSNSTVIVIVASLLATVYLALLDRLWMFVTGLVYGGGEGQ